MGRVTTAATMVNIGDAWNEQQGTLPPDQVRRVEVPDALVDSGATGLSVPTAVIARLGLSPVRTQNLRTTAGVRTATIYSAVRLTIQGRDCTMDVTEIPDCSPVLIGQLPLEALDFVIDMQGHQLIGNPRHGGEFMHERY
ncbi:MAG: retroviral-like aspartic protease family protein [Gemmataceae bacterium]